MAALVAGVQYGLSSHSNFYENKSLIFVKLTDSAQRAIEDYLRNRNKIEENPTIQFLGNKGQIRFPSTKNHGNFTFSLSNNQDIEGPQGGFECVQQIGPKNLESLGALPCKMRIQANDDVYETTRHRMHVAEENNKNKCTRVIKSNEPIGRKVKVKGAVRTIGPSSHSNLNASSKLSSSKPVSAYAPSRTQTETQKKLTEIMRRPLKERLIHLLALRPFKRPELYDRINREGLRDKEKNIVTTVLKQISFMRDNTYHLHRCVWNDVQEDWPFYSEQDKAMLKRRKPQNLTPPGSSDSGSSGSGQSPNSTHPGSPPAITTLPQGMSSSKRPGYYQGNDGLPTKRQRISHYRKPEPSCMGGSTEKLGINSGGANSWDQKQQQQQYHQQQNYQQQQHQNNCLPTKSNPSLNNENDEVNASVPVGSTKSEPQNDWTNHNANSRLSNSNYYYQQSQQQHQQKEPQQLKNVSCRKVATNNEDEVVTAIESSAISPETNFYPVDISTEGRSKNIGCRNKNVEQYNSSELSSLDSSSNTNTFSLSESKTVKESFLSFSPSSCNSITSSEAFCSSGSPDYLTYYSTINSSEQRTQYKAEFNAYYQEYRKLYMQVVEISKQFSQLEEKLKEKSDMNNTEGCEAIKHQILQEYAKTKSVNVRFYYLHYKLGHIKKLVSDYDARAHSGTVTKKGDNSAINHSDLGKDSTKRDIREMQCAFTQLPVEQPLTCSEVSETS